MRKTNPLEVSASTKNHGTYASSLTQYSLDAHKHTSNSSFLSPAPITDAFLTYDTLSCDLSKYKPYKNSESHHLNMKSQVKQTLVFVTNKRSCFGGHGFKAVNQAHCFMNLEPNEAVTTRFYITRYIGNNMPDQGFNNACQDQPLTRINLSEDDREIICGKNNSMLKCSQWGAIPMKKAP